MTASRFPLKCACGQTGVVKMSENDQPYSDPWEKYEVEGFTSAKSQLFVNGSVSLGEAITRLEITCSNCGASLRQENVI